MKKYMLLVLIALLAGCGRQESANALRHEIVSAVYSSDLGYKFLSVKVALLPDSMPPTREMLSKLINQLYAQYTASGQAKQVCVFVYASNELANGDNLWIAKFCTSDSDRGVVVMESELKRVQNSQRTEAKNGLTEDQRKQIFRELVSLDDVQDEAMMTEFNEWVATHRGQKWVPDKKKIKARETAKEKAEAELAKKYEITAQVLKEISTEGLENNWPMP